MYRLINLDGRAHLDIAGRAHDLAEVSGSPELADVGVAIKQHDRLNELSAMARERCGRAFDETELGPPVPEPRSIYAIGLNYRDHAEEAGLELPTRPMVFTKFHGSVAPPITVVDLTGDTVDWEVEVVVVVGTGGEHIDAVNAWDHVAGLTLGQDISDRTVQLDGALPQFSIGKSFTGFGPIGPALVSVDSFPDPNDIGLWCAVNDDVVQDSRTSNLIFPIPELIAYLSAVCPVASGDIIFTGTPAGVGGPQGRFLSDGDVLTSGADIIGDMRATFRKS